MDDPGDTPSAQKHNCIVAVYAVSEAAMSNFVATENNSLTLQPARTCRTTSHGYVASEAGYDRV